MTVYHAFDPAASAPAPLDPAPLDLAALDPAIIAWLDRVGQISAELGLRHDAPVDQRRQLGAQLSDRLFAEVGQPGPAGVTVTDHLVPGSGQAIRVRQYRPGDDGDRPLPAYVLLHGGAFWMGSIDDQVDRAICLERAAGAHWVVFDVEYRLAPEFPFPAGLDDAYDAVAWVWDQADRLGVDPERIVVGGVSAGGNLAAALCLMARDRSGPPIWGQLLEVPAVDLRPDGVWIEDYAEINGLGTLAEMRQFYLQGPVRADHPWVSPVAAADLAGLPRAHIITAEIDPLRAGGELFAQRLVQAGTPVTRTRHLGALHGMQGLTRTFAGARLWSAEVIAALREFAR